MTEWACHFYQQSSSRRTEAANAQHSSVLGDWLGKNLQRLEKTLMDAAELNMISESGLSYLKWSSIHSILHITVICFAMGQY